MQNLDETQLVNQVIERLVLKFPTVERSEIIHAVNDERHRHTGDPIRNYLPVLIERTVSKSFKSRAQPPLATPGRASTPTENTARG